MLRVFVLVYKIFISVCVANNYLYANKSWYMILFL